LLALDDALQRHRGALVDNLAKLQQLDTDIANAEHQLDGEEAAADPAKKSCIEQLLNRLHNERAARLEAASVQNRDALRTQFSRIRETITRILNEDTSLAERLRTLFRRMVQQKCVKKATKNPRRLAESAGRKGGRGAARNYWRHRLVASQDRGLGGCLACRALVGFSYGTDRRGCGLVARLSNKVKYYTDADCHDSEKRFCVFVSRPHGAARSLWLVFWSLYSSHIYGLVCCVCVHFRPVS